MAVLQKIRVKFGLAISIIIALALLSFIIDPGTLQSAMQTMSSKYDVGKINGKNISYTDFLEDVEKYTTINEMLTGGSVQNEETQAGIRDAAWQGLIDKYLFVKSAKDAGIVVGEDEMVDLTTGANPAPMVTQLFTDETGTFDPQNVVNFVRTIPDDATGRYQTLWDYVQNSVYTQQFYNKYAALFTYSDVLNKTMLKRALEENNTTADVDFVMIPYGYDTDSTIVVTEQEIKDYYEAHKEFYTQPASRDMEYILQRATSQLHLRRSTAFMRSSPQLTICAVSSQRILTGLSLLTGTSPASSTPFPQRSMTLYSLPRPRWETFLRLSATETTSM